MTTPSNLANALRVGMVVSGFCGGAFGRDSFGDKLCVGLGEDRGEPWAAFREVGGYGDWHIIHGDAVDGALEEADDVRFSA